MPQDIYSKAGADAATSAAINALGLGTAAVADASDFEAAGAIDAAFDALAVDQITLTAPLALTAPAGFPAGQVYRVTLTQDGTGGHTVTYGGSPMTVDMTAGASTLVEFWPGGDVAYPSETVAAADITDATPAGRALLTAADTDAQRAALSAAKTAKVDAWGGQCLAPVRVPALSVVESWPSPAAPWERLLWTENSGSTIYAIGRDRTIRKSTDSGRTWTKLGRTPATFATPFWKTTAGTLLGFRYDYDQLYRSTDDGATWAAVHTLPLKSLLGAQSICQDLVTGHLYYAEYPHDGKPSPTAVLWRSTDDGATWAPFYAFPTTGTDKIRHIHSVQWDHVAQRVVVSTGDTTPASGLYRVDAADTGVEPVVLNRDLPAGQVDLPRSIGIIPTPDYLVWAADSGSNPWVCRMRRDQIGQPSPVVEQIYRLNSSAWWTCRASDDGSRWVVCASSESPQRIDRLTHLYAVEDQGATVYEIGSIAPRKEADFTIAPVGSPGNHGSVFFMQPHQPGEVGAWKFALGVGSGLAIPWPTPIKVPLTKTVSCGPVTLAVGETVVFAVDAVPLSAANLYLFDAGAYGAGQAGVRVKLRVVGKDELISVGNPSERAARYQEWGGPIATYLNGAQITGFDIVEIVIHNQGAAQVTAATAFVTYGFGSGVGLV